MMPHFSKANLFHGVAENRHMVERNACEHADAWGVYDIGGVKSAAEADLKDGIIAAFAFKIHKRRSGYRLKLRGLNASRRKVVFNSVFDRRNTVGKLLGSYHSAVILDSLSEIRDIRRYKKALY